MALIVSNITFTFTNLDPKEAFKTASRLNEEEKLSGIRFERFAKKIKTPTQYISFSFSQNVENR